MLDRSTTNLFQAEPPDALPESPPTPFEGAEVPADSAVPTPAEIRQPPPTFAFPQLGACHRARARTAWRNARHFLTPLLIVLVVSRLATGGCNSESAPTPSAVTPRPFGVRAHLARPAHAKSVVPSKRPAVHTHQHHRYWKSARPVISVAPHPNALPTSPAAVTPKAAPPSGEATAVQSSATTRGAGQEFGFER
jgi:hypothetical protein